MGLPDYNIPLKRVGRLNWLEFSSFFGTAVRLIRTSHCDLLTTRVSSENGTSRLIYLGMQGGIKGKPYKRAELSWVYEDNFPSVN